MSSSEKLNDGWFRLIGIPLVALVANVLFFYDVNRTSNSSFFTDYIHSVLHAWILWEIARQMLLYTRKRFSSFAESKKRINYTLILVTLTAIVVMGGICAFYDITMYWGYHFNLRGYVYNIFVALMYAVIICSIYEGIYFFRKWREAFVEAEALKKENLQSQLESLKCQINPHFLFNSLSSLSSLIADDSTRAEKFVDELAAVYRYLLQTNDKELTTLKKELEFIHAYFHLLKTRFCDGIHLKVSIDKKNVNFLLPPLTLQILLENAVKHNVISKINPLKIEISVEGNNLVVSNNLQKKHSLVLSNRLGLANIEAKYRLLKQPKIVIRETSDQFKVIIPLIQHESITAIDVRDRPLLAKGYAPKFRHL